MGPLEGLRMIEMGGIGPGPFCAMMLADMGAEVVRIDRRNAPWQDGDPRVQVLHRGRRSVILDLKRPAGVDALLQMVERADALIEGFRPGVMEGLGVGPEQCLGRNPRLVYGRCTGWGQDGPLARAAGHDINYISLVGALHAIGRSDSNPPPPLNLIGDYGGGGMLLAYGVVCGLLEAQRSGRGQVVDAAMVDGVAALMALFWGMRAAALWRDDTREANMLDGGAPFYDTYQTADGGWVSIGSLEPQFYAELLARAGVDDSELQEQWDLARWPALRQRLTDVFRTKTREEWCELMAGSDVCFAPVLTMSEAIDHPHNRARNTFVEIGGVVQQAPAPRFSRTPGAVQGPPPAPGEHTERALRDWGFGDDDLEALRADGVIS
jgi:alpha-methylacyl-CoA racemase